MSDLIDNVLDFARVRLGGGITLSRDANLPLKPVLEQVVDELRTAAPHRLIETSFEITEPANRPHADRTTGVEPDRQRSYAWRAGPAGACGSGTESGELRLWIANASESIPAAAIEKLFEPFF